MRDIKLTGGEISLLKTLGLSGTPIHGKMLIKRAGEMEPAEFIDLLNGLLTMDYVLSSKVNVQSIVDVERSFFRVNPTHARELSDAMRPGQRREEERSRRQRRR